MTNDKVVIDLLYQAKENRIDVFLNEGQLQLKLPKNKDFDKKLFDQIKANKESIIDFLKRNERVGKPTYKINRFDRSTISRIPLSFTQERLWFVDQLEGSIPYHIPSILRLKGKLNKKALNFALKSIVARHEVLRSVIQSNEGSGYQQILDADGWKLNTIDGSEYQNNTHELQRTIEGLIKSPFDLSKDYMLRADLLCLNEEDYVLVSTMHHIASDGWSSSVLVKELIELYASGVEGRPAQLESLPIQYADYAVWQRNYLKGDLLEKKINYWKEKLEGITPIKLPLDFTRPAVQSNRGAVINFTVDKDLSDQLQELSQKQGATLFMTLFATLKVLLYRYSGQNDICVGTGNAGRQHRELEGLIGFFVNMLAIRTEVKGNVSFTHLLEQVKIATLEAYEHQDLPFEKVVNAVVEERDTSRSPLFQVLFEMQNTPDVPQLSLGGVELSSEAFEQGISKFDITFFLKATPTGLQGSIQYCTDLFREQTILRLLGHYKELLASIAKEPQQKLAQLQMLTAKEQTQLLDEFNGTSVEYPKDKSVVALFEEQAANTPENVAIIFEDEQLSYHQLNERSNQLASFLKTKGVKSGEFVPIFSERSTAMIVAILGILKAGAAYVPINSEYPIERINFLLKDIKATIVVSTTNSSTKLSSADIKEIIVIDDEFSSLNSQSKANVQSAIQPKDIAYVIYTSGSTGQPKGVMINHSSLLNYLLTNKDNYLTNKQGNSGTFMHLSYTFDASVTSIFMPLLAGKSVVIGSKQSVEVFEDPNLLKYAPYDFIKLTPSHLPLLEPVIKANPLLTGKLVIGGEALKYSHFNYLIEDEIDVKIINEYGPTEATVGCSTYSFHTIKDKEKVQGSKRISIGQPMDNAQLHILDNENNILPIGVEGEICIGGVGVSMGYLNREDLTKQKFVVNPFDRSENSRLYKTGDIGKWLADGNVEYIGRKDDQLKIRGYRVEPGEIEACLCLFEGVKDAKVIVSENKAANSQTLNAYVQVDKEKLPLLSNYLHVLNKKQPHLSEGDQGLEAILFLQDAEQQRTEDWVHPQEFSKAIRAYANERLPAFMIPANIILLDQFPLTVNGKIDTKALPKPEGINLDTEADLNALPESETQKALVEIWKDLLGLEVVGLHDNFFSLGGDSIVTIQMVSRARNAGLEFAVADVFAYQTIAKLAKHIEQSASIPVQVSAEQELLTGSSGLLPIQEWFFESETPAISHFNQSVLLGIDKAVTEDILQAALDALTEHHDALRFIYQQKDGSWQQEYGTQKGGLFVEDLQQVSSELLTQVIPERATYHQMHLDIEKGELIRIVLMQTPKTELNNRLFITIHHLAIDGVSWRIILEDLEKLLNALSVGKAANLGIKTSSYRQWFNALKDYGQTNKLLSQQPYWQHVITSNTFLPLDKSYDGRVKIKDTSIYSVRLEAEKTKQLIQDVPRVFHTEINDILLCALVRTLCKWSNTDKFVIGLEGHGREQVAEGIDTSRTVGWFTTIFPVLLNGDRNKEAGDLIKTVKEQLRQVPDKGLGFGVLKYINKEQSLQGTQPWDVVFNYMGQIENTARENSLLSIAEETTGEGINRDREVNEKISIHASIRAGQLILSWTYSTKNFNEETISNLANAYISNLKWLISNSLEQGKLTEVFTPSDYGLGSDVGYEELDAFLKEDETDNIMSF